MKTIYLILLFSCFPLFAAEKTEKAEEGKHVFKTVVIDGKEIIVVTSRTGPFPIGQIFVYEDSLPRGWDKPKEECGPSG